MPLNISIDVDGTILDANEKLLPHVRESLQSLKDAGHCLQLWSAGGADYAYKHALKNKLTDLFESYAKKSDVAIDDLPETAHPLAVVHVDHNHTLDQAVKKVLSIEQNVDAALTLNSKLVAFVKELQTDEIRIREQYETILCPDVPLPLHPIPFFGVIDKARAITVGLNPSPTEFTKARLWPKIMSPCELTQRLVRYFQPSEVMPHRWFSDLQKALETVRCPYYFAAAHVDASPWTTHAPRYLTTKRQRDLYNQLLADGIDNLLPKTFEFCKDTVKLVVILRSSDAPGEAEMARLPRIKEIIRRSFGERCKVVVKTRDEFYQWTLDDQNKLVRFLDFENVFP